MLPVLEVLTPTTVTILLLRLLGDNSGPLDITALVVTVEVGIERDGLGFPSWLSSLVVPPPPAAAAAATVVRWRADWELFSTDAEVTYIGLPVAASIRPFSSAEVSPLSDGASLSWNTYKREREKNKNVCVLEKEGILSSKKATTNEKSFALLLVCLKSSLDLHRSLVSCTTEKYFFSGKALTYYLCYHYVTSIFVCSLSEFSVTCNTCTHVYTLLRLLSLFTIYSTKTIYCYCCVPLYGETHLHKNRIHLNFSLCYG